MASPTPGLTMLPKKIITIRSRQSAIPTMMARSLAKIEAWIATRTGASGIAASNEGVACTVHGLDITRAAGVITKPRAQPADEHVDGTVEGIEFSTAEKVHDPLPAQDPAAIPHEQLEQVVLRSGQVERSTAKPRRAGLGIDLEVACSEAFGGTRHSAAQDGLDPRDEL